MAWKSLDEMDLQGQTVLTRVDINVPVEDGQVTDATRIERILPTVNDILAKGGMPVLIAHFGRPKGKVVPEMSLAVTLPALEAGLDRRVQLVALEDAPEAVGHQQEGEVLLLENIRFHPGEEKNDPVLASQLAGLGDVYVNDAFSAAHRAHASTEGIAHLMPACAGRLMAAELGALEAALGAPTRPLCAVVGGAKVSTKIDLLANLVERVDHLVIGGGMANTFLFAQGLEIGTSLAEREMAGTAQQILDKADESGCKIHLPVDIVVARKFEAQAPNETVPAEACPADAMILDAGPRTVERIETLFDDCKTVIWNGPLGAFEIPPFDAATVAAARAAAEATEAGLISVAGGGDTVAALHHAGVADNFTYVSTAGGAFLEWMEGKTLPGVAALEG
ncbi:MAG: phosphoglycerate kinase [Pseudomonadota bacterium]